NLPLAKLGLARCNADRIDRAHGEAGAAAAALIGVQLRSERPADARAKADRLHGTALAAGETGAAAPGKAGIADGGDVRKARRLFDRKDRLGTGGTALPAESA